MTISVSNYILWAIVALVAYTLVPPLARLASDQIPSNVVALISNGILVAVALGVVLYTGEFEMGHLTQPRSIYMYAAGVCLAVGILAYYRSLELGPVSIVTPIFGMFLVTSSVIGVVLLDESLTTRKMLGVAFAIAAVYLTSVE